MKNILVLISVIFIQTGFLYPQKAKVVSAWNYMQYNEFDKAKEAIDLASENESSKNMAKTWYYRGLIYHTIHNDSNWSYLSEGALEEAFDSFQEAMTLEEKDKYEEDIKKRMEMIGLQFYNKGVQLCKDKRYKEGLKSFGYTLKINPDDQQAIYNSAFASFKIEDIDKAKMYYQLLIDKNYDDARIYHTLADIHKSQKDTAKALEILQIGRAKFKDNNILIIDELNIYLAAGKQTEAIEKMKEAIVLEPNNATLYFALGVANDKIGNATEAENSYKKAIEIDQNYFDAVYNLGALYFNKAVDLVKAADDLKDPKKFDAAKAEYEQVFQLALPYLEKALQLNDKDVNTLMSLKQLYARLGQYDKSKEMKLKIESLGG